MDCQTTDRSSRTRVMFGQVISMYSTPYAQQRPHYQKWVRRRAVMTLKVAGLGRVRQSGK